jgi:hypothetical protein
MTRDSMLLGLTRATLGVAMVLHGLGNAVLQLRGGDAGAPGGLDLAWSLVCLTAIVGFVTAGLAVLGVRPLTPIAVLAPTGGGAAALVGVLWLGDPTLWPGVLFSLLLPVATWVWLRPSRATPTPRPWARALRDAAGLAFLAWIAFSALLWPWHRSWGTLPQEWVIALPGDRTPRLPAHEILHAVTIDAPPSAVWPWLVQLGQDRAGFYSYERLERLFGAQVHNVREIRPEWQQRQSGDVIYATQAGYLGGLLGERPGWTVDLAEPNRALVLRYWGAFVLEPMPDGRTRFLIRSTISHPDIPVWAAALNFSTFELPHFIMQRRMMLGIKELAEGQRSTRSRR